MALRAPALWGILPSMEVPATFPFHRTSVEASLQFLVLQSSGLLCGTLFCARTRCESQSKRMLVIPARAIITYYFHQAIVSVGFPLADAVAACCHRNVMTLQEILPACELPRGGFNHASWPAVLG